MKTLAALILTLAMAGSALADDYIVIVFDTSGSMADYMRSADKSRMDVAQDALVSVLSKVPDSTKVGILTFDGWIYDIQTVDRAAMEKAIRQTHPGGGTPLYEYVRLGATRLLKERQDRQNVGSYKLLVVTDGQAGDDWLNQEDTFGDGTIKPGVLQDILNRGVLIDAIGLDMEEDHALATLINGAYMRGDDSDSLQKALSKSVAEVGFDGTQDASDEAFRDVAELPEGFVLAALRGLTTFPNHPIGEKPPVEVVGEDGTITLQPDPASQPVAAPGSGIGTTVLWVVGGVVAVIALLLFLVAVFGSRY